MFTAPWSACQGKTMSLSPENRRQQDERDKEIVHAAKAGESGAAIAERLGLSIARVSTICTGNGVSLHLMRRKRRQMKADFIRVGGTIEQACEHFSCGSQTIIAACREETVPLPHRLPGSQGKVMAILRSLEDAPWGAKQQDIADKCGCSKQRISQVWCTAKRDGFFDNVIWCNTTGKCPKPEHMKDNGEADPA